MKLNAAKLLDLYDDPFKKRNNENDCEVVLDTKNLRRENNLYVNVAKQYIEEVIEPMMADIAKHQTYIELPAENDMEWGYPNSISFSKKIQSNIN